MSIRLTTTLFLFSSLIHFECLAAPEPSFPSTEISLEASLLKEGILRLGEAAETEGDPKRGALLFHQRKMACNRCHATGNGKSPLGPDLAKPNPKLTAVQIVESILVPSKVIEKRYQAVQLLTEDGRVLTGMLQKETKNAVTLLLPLQTGKSLDIPRKEIEEIVASRISLMPVGQVNLLADRTEFLDLVSYVLAIATHGPEKAKELQPDESLLTPLEETPVDHVATIAGLKSLDIDAGRKLYSRYCVNCHGVDGNKTLNPLARRFAKDKLKFGIDPYSMWKTISYGNGLMFPQSALLTPDERYLIVNYLRETFLRDANSTQYFKPTPDYLANINARASEDAEKFGSVKITISAGMIDGRQGHQMDYGSAMAHSVSFSNRFNQNTGESEQTTERALMVRLPGNQITCYDTTTGAVAGLWSGTLANTSKTHHVSYKGNSCMTPGGPVRYSNPDDAGWLSGTLADSPKGKPAYAFKGHYLHSGQVVLQHEIAGRCVEELSGLIPGNSPVYSRTFRIARGDQDLYCLIGRFPNGKAKINKLTATLRGKSSTLQAGVSGITQSLEMVDDDNGGLWLKLPGESESRTLTLWYTINPKPVDFVIPTSSRLPDFDLLTTGGPRMWPREVRTQGIPGEIIEGYSADELTIPQANPYGCWMRTTALDFFADGSLAVATLSGDIWIVRWNDGAMSDITWSRYASGLYEPLGLRIVDDIIYVRGRDRITRLRDLNNNGEADAYELFHQEGPIGAGYHAFLFDLQTDKAGNFYFARSGRKSPHKGGVIRVSADGQTSKLLCHDFRHPNGMGFGGPHNWITVSDNPNGEALFNGVAIVKEGHDYGYERPRTIPMLAVLPARVDSSSGGQCWADTKRWGPLSGQMIHTSYSRCAMFNIMTQNLDPHPNGFAVRMPFTFKSGVMRARVNPVDGQVYVVGQKGWDTQAQHDACLYRIRYHEKAPVHLIENAAATATGIRLMFSCDLDPKSLKKSNFEVIREEDKGTKPVSTGDVHMIDDRTIEVMLPEIREEIVALRTQIDKKSGRKTVRVNFPIRITAKLKAADGADIEQTVFATINSIPETK